MNKQNNVGVAPQGDPSSKKLPEYVGADASVCPQKRNTQTGITLIALVITIIILLILAMVSIKLVMNSGIITRAQKGVDEYSKAQEDETEKLLQAEYEAAKYEGKTTGTFTDYILETRYSGVKIGDYVNYDEGTGHTYETDTKRGVGGSVGTKDANTGKYQLNSKTYNLEDLNWRVLGVNAKGELELISDNPMSDANKIYLANEEGYLYGPDELNRMCNELYGKGDKATGARSLNVEDINKLANYDPTTYSGYGEKWTYRYPTEAEANNGTRYMQYRTDNPDGTQKTNWTNIISTSYQKFRMPGTDKTLDSDHPGTTNPLEYTYYTYNINKITDSNIANMISKGNENSNVSQWLASRFVRCYSSYACFYLRYVNSSVNFYGLYGSYDGSTSLSYRVRPVVSLKSDVKIDKTNGKDGTTADKAYTIK